MKVLHQKLLRELFAAKGVLAAIISIIAVGIGCFIAMSSTYDNLEYSRQSYYRLCRMADFSVELKKVPVGDLAALSEIPGVTNLFPRIVFEVTASLEGVEKPLSGKVISLPEHENAPINRIVIQQGSYFTDQRQEEVILNDAFARAHHLKPGDHIQLILNNHLQDLIIIGTAISSEFVYLIGPGGLVPEPESYGVFYLKHNYAEDVFGFEGAANQILGQVARDYQSPNRVRQILDQIELHLEDYGVFSTTPLAQQSSHWFLKSEIDGLKVSATILPCCFSDCRCPGSESSDVAHGGTAANRSRNYESARLFKSGSLYSLFAVWTPDRFGGRCLGNSDRLFAGRRHDGAVPTLFRVSCVIE